ncbi:putative Bet v I/Major latex protein [Helianthus annuus]|uniref:Bet v I/Major latex protein n=2 Tax=Helianthus annuus TaxID=4232 RepID=A0A9K3HFB2_HELAN|nr:MLP-like protein 43 [Helianthus annuus]KAF5777282.1 putative Bet v I/Major latex protein [Helianthus annuus]KAJ0488842.1 putative Bet v I/Major latex protein [Helianthus annuus]KAJ0492436.1 putative Bet v I/Major latex protein [Helianthus annuus]KAJ0504686.1 putative Bet v I/Major latex protein [Helianthus annuus]KAJ0674414.1 putative Bet v I/Major latex protein [Helianthus annuus]
MALIGTIIGKVEINSGAKVLHDLYRHTPDDISSICPDKIHSCDLLSGTRGAVGSTIIWHFTQDGKRQSLKEIIEEVNETNHKIVFKVLEGELVDEKYKAFTIIFHCEQKDGKQWAVWTIEFERLDTSIPYPTSFMEYLCDYLKEIDDHKTCK